MDYYKNKLMKKMLNEYYEVFSCTLDTSDFVPEEFNSKIYSYIFKNMKKSFKLIDKDARKHTKEVKLKLKNMKPKRQSFIKRLFNAFKKRKRVVKDKADYCCETTIDERDSASALDKNLSAYANEQQSK